jgi:hypothetical protein
LNYRRKKYTNNTPTPQPICGLPQNPYIPNPSSRSPQLRSRSPLGFSLLPSNQLQPSLSFSSPTPLGQSSFSAHQATFPSPGPIQLVRGKVPFYFFPLPFPHPHTSFTGSCLTTSFGVLYCLPPVSLPSIDLSL